MLVRTVWLGARDGLGPLLTTPGFGSALAHTFLLAAAVSGLSLALGSAFALALRNRAVPGRAFWRVALVLPVMVPDFVLGFSWLQAYGPAGFPQQVLGIAWPGVQGLLGVTVVASANAVPLVYLIVTAGLAARGEPALE